MGEFNSGALATVEELYGAMGLATGQQLITSAEKADRKRLRQSIHQEVASMKEARRARKLYVVDASARGPDYAKRDSLASNNGCHVEVMCLGSIWDEVRERFLAWQHVEDHVCTPFSPTEGSYKPWAAGDITFTRRC